MKVVQDLNLHEDDFTIQNGKVRTLKTAKSYKLDFAVGTDTITTNHPADYDKQARRQLTVLDGMGKIHLDFKMVKGIGPRQALFKLPPDAPRNLELIETQLWDGTSVWVDAGSPWVMGNSLKAGQRYIVDLIGFFG